MKTYELLPAVITAIQTNAALTAYATAQYGRAHVVFDSCSGEFPPPPDECPYFLVYSPGKSGNRISKEIGHGISVDCFVYDTADETRADAAEVSSGTIRLLTLMDMARAAIVAALPEIVIGYEETTNTVDLWPLLAGTAAYDFREQVYIGMDPLA